MFWDKWIPVKYLVKSEICAVELNFTENGREFYYTHLSNKSNKLNVVSTGISHDTLEFPKIIEKNKIPVLLIVNGKGILIKKVMISENAELPITEIIQQNLPALNLSEFYVQLYQQENNESFIAFCRKEIVDLVIKELKEKKFDLAGVLIGAPAVLGLKPLWTNFNSIHCSTHKAELTNQCIDNFSPAVPDQNEELKLDGISILPKHVLGFSGGLAYLTRRNIAGQEEGALSSLGRAHVEKNKFRFLMIVCVMLAFVFAATNVVFYTTYFDNNNKLETELSVYQGKYDQINKLLSDYQEKKGLIENTGILQGNSISEFADKIAKTIPEEVVLTEMTFNPKIEKDESEDSLIIFANKQLLIKGNCNKSMIVNEWVNVLKMQNFIRDVSLEKFTYNKDGFTPNYEIKLLTK
jgi:Tfp pilus assembly protein PilN